MPPSNACRGGLLRLALRLVVRGRQTQRGFRAGWAAWRSAGVLPTIADQVSEDNGDAARPPIPVQRSPGRVHRDHPALAANDRSTSPVGNHQPRRFVAGDRKYARRPGALRSCSTDEAARPFREGGAARGFREDQERSPAVEVCEWTNSVLGGSFIWRSPCRLSDSSTSKAGQRPRSSQASPTLTHHDLASACVAGIRSDMAAASLIFP